MRFLRSCLLAAIVGTSLVQGEHVLHEQRNMLPAGWTKQAATNKQQVLPIRIALKEQNIDQLYDHLMTVADPTSATYSQHWTPEQLRDTFAASEETVGAVKAWLLSEGIAEERVKLSGSKSWLNFDATVEEAEKLFQAEYHTYKHDKSGKITHATDKYHVPNFVQEHIDFVTPTLHFDSKVRQTVEAAAATPNPTNNTPPPDPTFSPLPTPPPVVHAKPVGRPKADYTTLPPPSDPNSLATCATTTTPACLRALYGFGGYQQKSTSRNSYGLNEFNNYYVPSDLTKFLTEYEPYAKGIQPKVVSVDGGYDDVVLAAANLNNAVEADLDVEYAQALVYPLQVTYYQVGDEVEGASFNDYLDAFDASYCSGDDPTQDATYPDPNGTPPQSYKGPKDCGDKKITNVLSTSYAYNEADLTPKYETRQCNEYGKLGLLGTSFLYSSGDYGVAGNGGDCIDDTTGQYSATGQRFNPSFPGTCPYVTAVGATQIKPGYSLNAFNAGQAEEACETVIYSGGGFSNVFPQPLYQIPAVQSYFFLHNPPYTSRQYNNSRRTRGFPDGANYVTTIDGQDLRVYGTSASSPTFGSIITLINDQRLAFGKRPVGFLNPSLYLNPFMFHDITQGGNQGCGTAGFTAVQGWDPVTGLGTPNFSAMLAYYTLLP